MTRPEVDRPDAEELRGAIRWLWHEAPGLGHALTFAPEEVRAAVLDVVDEKLDSLDGALDDESEASS